MKDPLNGRILASTVLLSLFWFCARATAYDAQTYNNLAKSRDALLTQRAHLQDAADQIGEKIDVLQRQLDTVNAYMRDTDSALRDVETAMNRSY